MLRALRGDPRLNRALDLGRERRLRDEVAKERQQFFEENPEVRRPKGED